MPVKIIMQKFGAFRFSGEEQKAYRSACAENKNKAFKKRLLKNRINRKPKEYKSLYDYNSFRKNWFCKGCSAIFNLKPGKRNKTLLVYSYYCPVCCSTHTVHFEALTRAVIGKLPAPELLTIAVAGNVYIEFGYDDKTKYYPTLRVTGEVRPKIKKEYFTLKDAGESVNI